jgi:hypothetical protein
MTWPRYSTTPAAARISTCSRAYSPHAMTCAENWSEWPQNRKRNHPRPRLMDTSRVTRVDGVKAPRHRETPRSHGQRLPVRQVPDLEHELQTRVVQRQQIRDALRAATQALGLVVEVDLDAALARDLGQGVLRRVICEGDTFDERNWDAD